jgi:hypothetical protein
MTKVLKAGGVWLLIAAVVWLITIWRWQTTALDVSAQDIVLQLFVLPVLLAGALLAALWGVRQLREQAAGPASSTPRSPGPHLGVGHCPQPACGPSRGTGLGGPGDG